MQYHESNSNGICVPVSKRERQELKRGMREQILKSERHVRLDRVRPLDPARGQPLRDQEGEFQRLVAVQSRVAECLVATHQICFNQVVAATDALSHVVAGELNVHTARPGAELFVYVKETIELSHDV